jgi:membrane protease YdiL (CAAX protease family)
MESSSMNPNMKRGEYPYPKTRVYLSAAIAVLSIILTVHILYFLEGKPILLLYYFASTSLITAIAFMLKSYLLPIRKPKPSGEKSLQAKEAPRWRTLIFIFCILLALMFVPLLLVMVLDPYSWFILIVSLTSGVSISEVFFYIRTR